MNKFPIKITLVALVLLIMSLWLLFPRDATRDNASDKQGSATGAATIVSVIQPISAASANNTLSELGIASGPINFREGVKVNSLSTDELASLSRRFDDANAAIERGDIDAGLKGLEALIAEYPSVIEPYLNVASVYAEREDLEKARATLLSGFSANPKAGMLFDHLKKVHGALAASSYRQALETGSPKESNITLILARASSISTELDQSKQIAALQKMLQESQNQSQGQNQSQSRVAEPENPLQAQKVAALESSLRDLEEGKLVDQSIYERELGGLKKQIYEQSQALLLSQIAERDALNQLAEITEQLESQKAVVVPARASSSELAITLAKSQQQAQAYAVLDAENSKLREENEKMAQAAVADESVISGASLIQKTRQKNAIDLVQSWAKAWSEQDVSAYVEHYGENYSSSRSLSRAQWLEQREVRLTNKSFISFEVSNFEVEDMGPQFSVIFSQYYRSNTVDDRVTKRLIFNKIGDDWSQSKILEEQVVSGSPE
jgi:colicin import membrane protein